jgi:hypothetical protein
MTLMREVVVVQENRNSEKEMEETIATDNNNNENEEEAEEDEENDWQREFQVEEENEGPEAAEAEESEEESEDDVVEEIEEAQPVQQKKQPKRKKPKPKKTWKTVPLEDLRDCSFKTFVAGFSVHSSVHFVFKSSQKKCSLRENIQCLLKLASIEEGDLRDESFGETIVTEEEEAILRRRDDAVLLVAQNTRGIYSNAERENALKEFQILNEKGPKLCIDYRSRKTVTEENFMEVAFENEKTLTDALSVIERARTKDQFSPSPVKKTKLSPEFARKRERKNADEEPNDNNRNRYFLLHEQRVILDNFLKSHKNVNLRLEPEHLKSLQTQCMISNANVISNYFKRVKKSNDDDDDIDDDSRELEVDSLVLSSPTRRTFSGYEVQVENPVECKISRVTLIEESNEVQENYQVVSGIPTYRIGLLTETTNNTNGNNRKRVESNNTNSNTASKSTNGKSTSSRRNRKKGATETNNGANMSSRALSGILVH